MGDNRVTRCVTLPIRAIVQVDGTEDAKILDALRPAWRLSTDLANWCQRELVLADSLRQPEQKKIGKYEPKCLPNGRSLYQRVNDACPFRGLFAGAAGSMGAVVKHVEDAWRSHPRFGRFAVLWKGESAPCVFRFPYPWPVRSQELRIYRDANGRPCASVTLPGGRVDMRLGDGPDFRRQLRAFDTMLGDVKRLKAAKITGRRKAGKMVGADLRIVGSFDAVEKAGTLAAVIRTDPNALLVVEVEGRHPWILNRDDLRHLQSAHRVYRQRMAEDLKHEKRNPRRQRRGMVESLGRRCDKHAARMDTALHQVSAQVVGYLTRCGVGTAVYDDSEKAYMPDGFPWAMLRERVGYKLAGFGVEVVSSEPVTTGGE